MLANIASQRRIIRQPSFDEYPKVDHAKRTSVQWHGELDNAKKKRLQWAISRSESTPNIFARRVRKVIRCRKDANDDLFINLNISGKSGVIAQVRSQWGLGNPWDTGDG